MKGLRDRCGGFLFWVNKKECIPLLFNSVLIDIVTAVGTKVSMTMQS